MMYTKLFRCPKCSVRYCVRYDAKAGIAHTKKVLYEMGLTEIEYLIHVNEHVIKNGERLLCKIS
jgi:hypothetical protein